MEAWTTLRHGSSFEVPEFRPIPNPARFPLATGNSKKLYEAAVTRALYKACAPTPGQYHHAVHYNADVSFTADDQLFRRSYA